MPTFAPQLPTYLQHFSCYVLRVQFAAKKNVEIQGDWAHLPSYALGDALTNSEKYSYLYKTLFKPEPKLYKNIPSRMIVRADSARRFQFSRNEILNVYVTIVGNKRQEIVDFINFLPEWADFHFFKKHSFRFHSAYSLNPASNEFEAVNKTEISPLDFQFFNNRLIKWDNALELRFLTPTTYLKDQLLTVDVVYPELIKRIKNRVFNLYQSFLAPDPQAVTNDNQNDEEKHAATLLNAVSFPPRTNLKNNKYDLAGVKGFISFSVPYSYEDDFLLTLAHYVHMGNQTIRGNGQIQCLPCNTDFFDLFVEKLKGEPIDDVTTTQIRHNAYIPAPYRSVKIPKSNGSYRELEIPAREDVLLQKIMAAVLNPIIDAKLAFQNFAYRKGKGALAAIRQVQKWKSDFAETHYIVRCDIDNFFDTISVDRLLKKLYAIVSDPQLCHLVALWIKSGKIDRHNQYVENTNGIPQGSALSPLLANLYLADFDRFIEHKITKQFIRYADDILLLVPKDEKIIRVLQMLTDYLNSNLRLNLNQEFYAGSLKDGFSFLGIEFESSGKLGMNSDKKNRVDDKIKHALWADDENDFTELEKTVAGLKNYYGKLLDADDKTEIDDIIVSVYRDYLHEKAKPATLTAVAERLSKIGFLTDKYADARWAKQIKPKKTTPIHKPLSAEQNLKIQKRRHLQQQAEACELVVTIPGSFIGISKNRIQVKSGGKVLKTVPINAVRQISILCEGVSVSSYITKHCAKKNIQITYFNSHGEMYAALNNPANILPENMQCQLQLTDERKMLFISELVKNKAQNQRKLLKYYAKYNRKSNPSLHGELISCIEEMNAKMEHTPLDTGYEDLRKSLFLWEAQFALIYWRGVRALIADTPYPFEQREHQNATGIVNQMLNYGYALLESKVMRTIHSWQISPNVSYLHAISGNTPSLCFDLMEQYRTFVVDRSVIAIIKKGEKVAQEENSGLLTLETRKKLISKINERWYAVETYKGNEMLLTEVMHRLMEHFMEYCIGTESKPQFYKPKW